MACGHTKCEKSKKASNMMGSQINIFLSLVSAGTYDVESRDGITIEVNTMDDDKEYMVCHNTKLRIEATVVITARKERVNCHRHQQLILIIPLVSP